MSTENTIINKANIVSQIVKENKITKKAAEAVFTSAINSIVKSLAEGNKVQIVGFGTFVATERKARKGSNPKTGEIIDIPESIVPKFKPCKAFKDLVNGKEKTNDESSSDEEDDTDEA